MFRESAAGNAKGAVLRGGGPMLHQHLHHQHPAPLPIFSCVLWSLWQPTQYLGAAPAPRGRGGPARSRCAPLPPQQPSGRFPPPPPILRTPMNSSLAAARCGMAPNAFCSPRRRRGGAHEDFLGLRPNLGLRLRRGPRRDARALARLGARGKLRRAGAPLLSSPASSFQLSAPAASLSSATFGSEFQC
jgi:hypothetical protein